MRSERVGHCRTSTLREALLSASTATSRTLSFVIVLQHIQLRSDNLRLKRRHSQAVNHPFVATDAPGLLVDVRNKSAPVILERSCHKALGACLNRQQLASSTPPPVDV